MPLEGMSRITNNLKECKIPNIGAHKYIKQIFPDIKGEIDSNINIQ